MLPTISYIGTHVQPGKHAQFAPCLLPPCRSEVGSLGSLDTTVQYLCQLQSELGLCVIVYETARQPENVDLSGHPCPTFLLSTRQDAVGFAILSNVLGLDSDSLGFMTTVRS